MIKFRLYLDVDKGEKFVNEIASKGYILKHVFAGFYVFEECKDNEYTYRYEFIGNMTKEAQDEFYDLAIDSGAELVGAFGAWALFRKKGDFQLYTDSESKTSYYKRIRKIYTVLVCFMLIYTIPALLRIWGTRQYSQGVSKLFLIISCINSFFLILFSVQVYKYSKKIKKLEKN